MTRGGEDDETSKNGRRGEGEDDERSRKERMKGGEEDVL